MTQIEKRQRRRSIANAVAGGSGLGKAARDFEVTFDTAYRACQEFGIQWQRTPVRVILLEIVGALVRGETQSAIASRLHVSRQRIGAIAKEAEKYGILKCPRST